MLQNVPTKGNRLLFHLENVHLVPVIWVVQCPMPCVMVITVKETEEDPYENDIEYFVAFSIKSLEGFAILDGRATRNRFWIHERSTSSESIRGYHD